MFVFHSATPIGSSPFVDRISLLVPGTSAAAATAGDPAVEASATRSTGPGVEDAATPERNLRLFIVSMPTLMCRYSPPENRLRQRADCCQPSHRQLRVRVRSGIGPNICCYQQQKGLTDIERCKIYEYQRSTEREHPGFEKHTSRVRSGIGFHSLLVSSDSESDVTRGRRAHTRDLRGVPVESGSDFTRQRRNPHALISLQPRLLSSVPEQRFDFVNHRRVRGLGS